MSNDHPHYVRPEDRARPEDPSVFNRAPRREPFEGLLRFVELQRGRLEITNGTFADKRQWWQVAVFWESLGEGSRKVYSEAPSFNEACELCRGLLAHSLASGVATP